MSYARVDKSSDVYVWSNGEEFTIHVNAGCIITSCSGNSYKILTLAELRLRLLWLKRKGYKVPRYCMDRINKSLKESKK